MEGRLFEVPNPQWRRGAGCFGNLEGPKKPVFCRGGMHFLWSNPFLYTLVELENGNKFIQ